MGGSVVVEALCYKPEGNVFDTQWGEFLNLPNLSGRTRPCGLHSLERSTTNIKTIMFLESKVRPVRRADNLTPMCEPIL
jgi:hypothetical protein